MSLFTLPSRRETRVILMVIAVWLIVTALFVGLRPEHIWLCLLLTGLLFITAPTRRMVVALLPLIIFAISYDWMNILPNSEVNPVDISALDEA